jgi:hypothetical protein
MRAPRAMQRPVAASGGANGVSLPVASLSSTSLIELRASDVMVPSHLAVPTGCRKDEEKARAKAKEKDRGGKPASAATGYETYSFGEAQWKKQLESKYTAVLAENKRLKASASAGASSMDVDAGQDAAAEPGSEQPPEEELKDLEAFVKNNKEAAKTSVFSKIASDAAEEKAVRLRERIKAAKPAETLHRAVLGKLQKAQHRREKQNEKLTLLRQGLAATQKEIGELLALRAANEIEIAGYEAEFTLTAAATVPKVEVVQQTVLSEAELASKPELKAFQESTAFKDWQLAMQAAQEAAAADESQRVQALVEKQAADKKAAAEAAKQAAIDARAAAMPAGDDCSFDELDPESMDALFKLSGDRRAFDEYISTQGVGKKARKDL